ncbi:MAG: histone deacetylase family protein [Candidatus Baltobacteraceae bacterium]
MRVVTDITLGAHLRGSTHPESPDRVVRVAEALRSYAAITIVEESFEADDATLALVHPQSYIDLVARECEAAQGSRSLSTGDVLVDANSFAVARHAVGSVLRAYEGVGEDGAPRFALVRPPGHHAEPARGMGFCLFNNVGILARHIRARTGARVAILDIDYHHGNGTQALVGDGISYISSHAWPAYPGSGGPKEQARTESDDLLLNLPIDPRGISTEAFVALWERVAAFLERSLRPEAIVVSAGFDYVRGDPVGDLGVERHAAGSLACIFAQLAGTLGAPLLYVLEGGYDIENIVGSIAEIAAVHDRGAAGSSGAEAAAIPAHLQTIFERVETLR